HSRYAELDLIGGAVKTADSLTLSALHLTSENLGTYAADTVYETKRTATGLWSDWFGRLLDCGLGLRAGTEVVDMVWYGSSLRANSLYPSLLVELQPVEGTFPANASPVLEEITFTLDTADHPEIVGEPISVVI